MTLAQQEDISEQLDDLGFTSTDIAEILDVVENVLEGEGE